LKKAKYGSPGATCLDPSVLGGPSSALSSSFHSIRGKGERDENKQLPHLLLGEFLSLKRIVK